MSQNKIALILSSQNFKWTFFKLKNRRCDSVPQKYVEIKIKIMGSIH